MVILLLILILWCRHSTAAADWYATHLYPGISRILGGLAAPFGFSLTEIVIALLALTFIVRFIRIFKDPERRGKRIWRAVRVLLWAYVWFYAAWGINYYRSDIYARTGSVPMPYEEVEFHEFLEELAEQLNANWCPESELAAVDQKAFEKSLKDWYAALPEEDGLCRPRKWQHPKRPVFNRLYSAVGVLGFIGPCFDEMHVNSEITPLERPFVHAHEYSHVLGVSGEAEANFWAFEATRASDIQAVRYSGWYMLLHYVWNNVHSLLGDEQFAEWRATLRPEILEDIVRTQNYWQERRSAGLARVQKRFYDFFLRSNHIADGTKNYSQVLRLVLTLSDLHGHEHGEEG